MSDRIFKSVDNNNDSSNQIIQSCQSVWMAHWMRTSCNATTQTCNHLPNAVENIQLDYATAEHNSANGLKVSRSLKRLREIETRTFEIMNGGLRMSSENLRNQGLEFQEIPLARPVNGGSSSLFRNGQETDDVQELRPLSRHHSEHSKAIDCESGIQFPSIYAGIRAQNEISSRYEGTMKNPLEWIKTTNSSANNGPFADPFVKSSSHVGKMELDKGKAAVSSFIGSENQLADSNLKILENSNSCFVESNSSSFDAPPTSNHHLSTFGREWFQKMQKCSGIELFPSHFIASQKSESKKKSNYDCHPLPNCVSRFSQTTHSLLITKKTDVNLSKENDAFRSKRGVFGNTQRRGVMLQSLSNSNDSEEKRNVEYAKASKVVIKNESSAETDAMDLNSFKEKNPQSVLFPSLATDASASSAPSKKAMNMDLNLPPRIAVSSSRKINSRLPDINLDLPALANAETSSDNVGPISSRTQSFEMGPTQKSNLPLDPSNRWVKRLKLSSSHSSSQGTKSSNMAENSTHKKYFDRISKPTERSPCGKESVVSDKRMCLSKGKELLPSHAWIQRWLSNGSNVNQKESEKIVFCEPQDSTLALEDLQRKQFPSIAAMALMGKAMNGCQPCELQKKGSFTVWNTKSL